MSGTIVVTGAASGIGRAVLVELALGSQDVLGLDVDRELLCQACTGLTTARMAVLDLLDDEAVRDALESAGEISAVVHCAALFPRLTFAEADLSDLDRVMGVNFRAAFLLTKLAAERMQQGGSIGVLTSGAGLLEAATDPFQRPFALYGASKAALDRWALGVASELAERGIALTTITPGAFVRTPGTGGIDPDDMPEITAERVAQAVSWLARKPRLSLAGWRLSAVEFETNWG